MYFLFFSLVLTIWNSAQILTGKSRDVFVAVAIASFCGGIIALMIRTHSPEELSLWFITSLIGAPINPTSLIEPPDWHRMRVIWAVLAATVSGDALALLDRGRYRRYHQLRKAGQRDAEVA
jgi:hypothetical protein